MICPDCGRLKHHGPCKDHAPDCAWHLDQYPWECTCAKRHGAQNKNPESQTPPSQQVPTPSSNT